MNLQANAHTSVLVVHNFVAMAPNVHIGPPGTNTFFFWFCFFAIARIQNARIQNLINGPSDYSHCLTYIMVQQYSKRELRLLLSNCLYPPNTQGATGRDVDEECPLGQRVGKLQDSCQGGRTVHHPRQVASVTSVLPLSHE